MAAVRASVSANLSEQNNPNKNAYDELLARVSGAVKPSDVLEEIWVRDVIDLVWEALRLRRLKADLIAANAHEGLEQILVPPDRLG